MQLEQGKWYVDRTGSRWHIDYVGTNGASGHDESGYVRTWLANGRFSTASEYEADLVSEYKETTLRPWNSPQEFPPDAWIRNKADTATWRKITGAVLMNGFWFMHLNGSTLGPISLDAILDEYEHSTDGGETWLPCGKVEA